MKKWIFLLVCIVAVVFIIKKCTKSDSEFVGTWGTEGNTIVMSLKADGKAKSSGQQNVEFLHWELTGDSITFLVRASGGAEFTMPWHIELITSDKLVLTLGTSTLDMHRLD